MGHLYGDPIEVRGADGAVVTLLREAGAGVTQPRSAGDGATTTSAVGEVTAPASFLWRGKVYLVRGVLARWRERMPWWSSPSARLAQGDLPADPLEGSDEGAAEGTDGWLQPFRGSRAGGDDRPVRGSAPEPGVPGPAGPAAFEREVWRVEACCGRLAPVGVFDLCRELSPEEAALTVFDVPGPGEDRINRPAPHGPTPHRSGPGAWRLLRVCD